MPLVSIIVPVYNVENYIARCLDSIISQTYRNIEVVLVDDGTKDNSIGIVERYLSDCRIKIVHRENGGLSAARNLGLDCATGEFVCFIDSDDSIQSRMIEVLLNVINLTGVDFARCDLRHIHHDDEVTDVGDFDKSKISILSYPIKDFVRRGFWPSVCHTLFRRSVIGDLRFKEGVVHEDLDFTYRFLLRVQSGVHIPWIGYNYFHTSNSITRSGFSVRQVHDYDVIVRGLYRLYKNERPRRELTLLRKKVLAPVCKNILKISRRAYRHKNFEISFAAKKIANGLIRDKVVLLTDLSPRLWLPLAFELMFRYRGGLK